MIIRFPKSFETGFFIFLVAFWLVSFLAERSTLGRLIMGYRSELYPMSTFAVYTGPKQKLVSVFKFEIVINKGDEPFEIDAYDMFYPVQAPDLDDEIATRQLLFLVDSFRKHCPRYQSWSVNKCNDHPAPQYILQKDIGEMFQRSLEFHYELTEPVESITLKQYKYPFDTKTYQMLPSYQQYLVTFYPARDENRPDGWTGEKPVKQILKQDMANDHDGA